MITEAITTAAEYVAGLGLDAAKERAHEKLRTPPRQITSTGEIEQSFR